MIETTLIHLQGMYIIYMVVLMALRNRRSLGVTNTHILAHHRLKNTCIDLIFHHPVCGANLSSPF
jgi:hypothetical protein